MRRPQLGARRLAPQFPDEDPEDAYVGINTRLRRRLWKRLQRIADAEGKSRNYVVEFFLQWAADDYEATKKSNKK